MNFLIVLYVVAMRIATFTVIPFIYAVYRYICMIRNYDFIKERKGFGTVKRPEGVVIWVHASSVGEVNAAFVLINEMRAQCNTYEVSFLVTTFTEKGKEALLRRGDANVLHQFIPIDSDLYVNRFLAYWKPSLAILIEAELWPNLMMCTKKVCEIVLINARMSPKSFKKWQYAKESVAYLLNMCSVVIASSLEAKTRYEALSGMHVECFGNIKYSAEKLHVDAEMLSAFNSAINLRPVILFSSIQAREIPYILATCKKLKDTVHNVLIIIVPRLPNIGKKILVAASDMGMSSILRSDGAMVEAGTEVYIADTMGELGVFYSVAKIVFVGGSLIAHGGQNMIEPARFGCAILIGPHYFNFADIVSNMKERDAILETSCTKLYDDIIYLLSSDEVVDALAYNAFCYVNEKLNVAQDVVANMLESVNV